MEKYEVTVRTSLAADTGSYNTVWVTLIGTQGESSAVLMDGEGQWLTPGSARTFTVSVEKPLGSVVLVRLRLEPRLGFPNLDWFCLAVEVRRDTAGVANEPEHFPCHKWLQTVDGDVELRKAHVCVGSKEKLQILKDHRAKELQTKQQVFRWKTYVEGVPQCVDMSSVKSLGPNLHHLRQSPGINLQYLRGFVERDTPWPNLEELAIMFAHNSTENSIAKYVQAHWKEDSFFGYQCLNGCNPLMLRQIRRTPPNLSVTSDMLRPFLPEDSSLELEMERGNIFLIDYEVLEGVPANIINGKQQYLAAPLCLLHYSQGELKPIAIQLQQNPGPENPVFMPSDSELDWLLAKTWTRSADFQCHQLISHYLLSHMLGEVCCTATIRQLPEIHPLYQLLMPHIWTALQINIQARTSLLGPGGVFDKAIACGLAGVPVLLRRGLERMCYRSLCVPDDLEDRGVGVLPISHYSQDALRLWGALHRFVIDWVDVYYSDDSEVQQDSELQSWIQEIFTEGFLGLSHTGIPQMFQTKGELSKFVTMVIFTSSAHHSAVNFSQLDFNLWMPNCPATMGRPPPRSKGSVTMKDFLSTLPDVNTTCSVLITLFLLSKPAVSFTPLCQYREPYFQSGAPKSLVEALQKELRSIIGEIRERNSKLELPYTYLSPDNIENSVAI